MLPKARRRSARRLGWWFGRRKNRRVRESALVPRPPRPPLSASLRAALARWRHVLLLAGVAVVFGAAAYGGHYYVTHSRHFAMRAVRVSPTAHVAAEALIARAGVPLGVNLFAIDRDEVARAISQEPWVARVHVRRELPSTLVLDVVERRPACAVALGALYLADGDGWLFKRASPDEAAALPVVTGLDRDEYVAEPERARAAIRQALAAVAAWRARDGRDPIGEAHVDRIAGVTLYSERGVGVRIGVVDDTLNDRLRRCDAVAKALQETGESARLIYVDNRARPDRVTVKLASAQLSAQSGIRN
jgi:cell division protein FtsQ